MEIKMEAEYKNGVESHTFTVDPNAVHTTLGATTKSSIVLPNYIDRDMPSVPNNSTYLGKLRSMVTTLQDDINVYLTAKMNAVKEQDLQDDDDEEEDEEEEEDE